ncbi:hypothetical protein [Neisseria sp.]|uniref:hypothetical protein n=1 Tax=Neisseria TaxID=482 RepID=UPI0026DA7EB4|nr:hypothetical protein [Neisseria sp.]MDO4226753.1 hypothetical protein [Neisseria sp.]MDO4227768.1 hypothetical protein [Neisseria sp.]
MIKRDRLEWLLFESTIVDINFSKWNQYVQIVFLATWDKFEDNVFPIYDFKKINFRKLNKFIFELASNSIDSQNKGETRGLNVSDATILKNSTNFEIIINLEFNGSIQFSCESCEIIDLSNDENKFFKKKVLKNGIHFITKNN